MAALGPAPAPSPARAGREAALRLDIQALQAAVAQLDDPQATAAQISVSGVSGRWYGAAGAADLRTGRKVTAGDKFRIGSITKVFVATVVLQLSAQGRVDLDAPVQRYLPGVLPAGYPPITVGQLLDHTSGLPDESGPGLPDMSTPEKVLQHRYDRRTPQQAVAAVSHGPMKFAPGTRQEYRGINYVLAALLVEKVTGHSYGTEIGRRILRPLGLHDTSVAGDDPRIHGPHVHGYLALADGTLSDATVFNQSEAWGEGEMISTSRDLERFMTALFSGELLPRATLDRMFTLPSGDVRMVDGSPARYSMGLQTVTVNGMTMWGKTGERYGYNSGMFATKDQQRRVVYSFNPTHRDRTQMRMTQRIADAVTRNG
ncbi:serine hydrolase domain-containing protein [Streptomyces mashuensis]|uniref:serine hydrolase domain-containing protein n=1 Tax=Streptomyces mashuensis TaxID=33904 RepID=UPI001E5E65BC|nr:serine hydrolase domain-containing protein [Streptomyces mashuensis]